MSAHGKFCWNELLTQDVERAKAFYAKAVGWTYEAAHTLDGNTYWICLIDGERAGGIFDLTSMRGCENIPEHWVPYLAVDDVDARASAAVEAGAVLQRPVFDIPGVGRVALLAQPGGGGVAWMTPLPREAA